MDNTWPFPLRWVAQEKRDDTNPHQKIKAPGVSAEWSQGDTRKYSAEAAGVVSESIRDNASL